MTFFAGPVTGLPRELLEVPEHSDRFIYPRLIQAQLRFQSRQVMRFNDTTQYDLSLNERQLALSILRERVERLTYEFRAQARLAHYYFEGEIGQAQIDQVEQAARTIQKAFRTFKEINGPS